jgi:hypothetical protein
MDQAQSMQGDKRPLWDGTNQQLQQHSSNKNLLLVLLKSNLGV